MSRIKDIPLANEQLVKEVNNRLRSNWLKSNWLRRGSNRLMSNWLKSNWLMSN